MNVLSVENLEEDVLFVISSSILHREELLFRGHVSTRAIEHACNLVFSKQHTQDDPNVATDVRKLHQACMFYHLALQEFQTLALHKTLFVEDGISDASVCSAFCRSSLYPPKKKTSVSCLVGDGYLSLEPRFAHAPKSVQVVPEAKKPRLQSIVTGGSCVATPTAVAGGRVLSSLRLQ